MESQFERIREQQKETWNKFSPGWKKWDELNMDFLKPMTDAIVRSLQPKGNELVLDIASGTGEPALTIAAMLNDGKVILTDLSEGMLEVARENAARQGITNIETVACDAGDLPFADDTFDMVSCRLGFMFFPDMLHTAKEFFRVLKHGGKIATTVWGAPEKNFWASATMDIINKYLDIPTPPAGTPGLYRCAEKGLVAGLLQEAGFKHVTESEVNGMLNLPSIDVYWNFTTEVNAGVVAALGKADDAMKAKIKSGVYESIANKFPSGTLAIDSSALIIYGEK
jgi:ubiquinone/menaquinone biosynthesis C-methylase UbiE